MFKFHTIAENRRYRAMKKYRKECHNLPERYKYPCRVQFEDKEYTAFLHRFSIVLTKENPRRIKFQKECGFEEFKTEVKGVGKGEKVNIEKIISKAKKMGYVQKGTDSKIKFAVKYNEYYYDMNVLLRAYRIIDNGEKVEIFNGMARDKFAPLIIRNSIGICSILPFRYNTDTFKNVIVINI